MEEGGGGDIYKVSNFRRRLQKGVERRRLLLLCCLPHVLMRLRRILPFPRLLLVYPPQKRNGKCQTDQIFPFTFFPCKNH